MFVKPAKPGLVLRHPGTGAPLPPDGGELPGTYALRRIRDGDALIADPPRPSTGPLPPKTEG